MLGRSGANPLRAKVVAPRTPVSASVPFPTKSLGEPQEAHRQATPIRKRFRCGKA